MTSAELVFDPFSDDFFNHPYDTYRRMRDEAPVYYSPEYDFFALSRHEDVAAALKAPETFSSAKGITIDQVQSGEPLPPSLIWMDPPDHRRFRGLVNKVFTPRAITAQEEMVRATIEKFLDAVDPDAFDVVQDFSALFPVEVITTMLGVPPEHRQSVRLWIDKSLARQPGQVGMSEEGLQAGFASWMLYYELIQQRRAESQNDMISSLITVEVERDGGGRTCLDDGEIAGFAALLGGAGAETVTKLIGNAIVTFGRERDQWRQLYEDRSKIAGAVEELLRYEAPAQYVVRVTKHAAELHGTTIPAGKAVLLMVGAANRDDRAFTDAATFDINRDRTQAQNIGLGYGIHSCLGAALARMESAIALDYLLDFMPDFDLQHDGLRRVAMANVAGWSSVPVRVNK
ncbi:cytochrome P450 [Mycolicibacterium komossense]|uniref:Cytochrome P450 n=1 Tax=Mycolicibacterium komossense TaxID=1779 RepID=A0ABT3C7B8_9MYCO|nr:cytochrome P450 [Mycolicibacterium komossense]MCV7225362.1 cytochrome P450 [Mycolicibacterium komossense]